MKNTLIISLLLSITHIGCASERLYVKVVDDEGVPVSNATVNVGFSSGHVVFGQGRSCDYKAKTGQDGNAVVRFNGGSSDVYWSVRADGYYPSDIRHEVFNIEVVQIPPIFYKVNMLEHEKHGEITLYRKINPQPMYAYTREMGVKSPIVNGRYGFDLECFDWLPPHGKGKVADFYYVRDRPDDARDKRFAKRGESDFFLFKNGEPGYPKLGDVIGRIEFDENCGAYIGKQTGCASFPSAYQADVNREYMRSFPITIRGNGSHAIWLEEGDVVNCGEYMVIRSRVKCDEHGKIVSANYSKILGSMGLTGRVGVEESVFNPRPNDTNLEFDPARNLYQGKKGRGMIP